MGRQDRDELAGSAVADAALRCIQQSGALDGTRRLLAAVSGGCDSVALLHILLALRERLGADLHVASLDHGLRGAAGACDLAFVSELAAEWGLPCTLGRADVPQLAQEHGIGIEAAARQARYDFLAEVARQQDTDAVAVAHHLDDQAETVLLRMARGSGLRGLRGMRAASPMPGHADIRLIRPLLTVSRAEIEAYCTAHALDFRQDASNDDLSYRRNFLRHEVMPRLREVNPQLALALARLAESAAVDEDWLDACFRDHILPLVGRSPGRWRIGMRDYAGLHSALRRRLLRAAVEQLSDGQTTLPHDLIVDLEAWALGAQAGARRDVGGGLQLRVDYKSLVIEEVGAAPDSGGYRLIPRDCDIPLAPEQHITIGGLDLRVLRETPPLDSAGVQLPASAELRLRTRQRGDRFCPKGMGGRSRKLKDWLIDRKVPRQLRDQIPLLCADGAIVAICMGETWHLAHPAATGDGEATLTVSLG